MHFTWLGHGGWLIEGGGKRIALDPFLDNSPVAPAQGERTLTSADLDVDYLLISHGHFDHTADAAGIAKRCGATLVAIYEVAEWFRTQQQVESVVGMNRGGWVELPFGRVKMTVALHSSQMPDGSYGGEAAGFVIEADGQRAYFACDTALFSDMQLIGNLGLDLAVVPIGDLFTMGIEDSVQAIRLLRPKSVLPAHYNTWPPIAQDPQSWADRVRRETDAKPVVLQPGESFALG